MSPAAAAEPRRRQEVTLRVICRRCQRLQKRRGSQGIYWRCRYEGCVDADGRQTLNVGPKMQAALAEQASPRRRPRKAPTAAGAEPAREEQQPAVPKGGSSQPPPPARQVRRRTVRQPAAENGRHGAAGDPPTPLQVHETPPASPPPPRRGWFDRLVIGEDA